MAEPNNINDPCDFGIPEACGVNPAFQYTRYPCDFDDQRGPDDVRGLPIIIDNETLVKAEVVNRQREAILALEAEVGIEPSSTYTTVRHRLDALEQRLCFMWENMGGGGGAPVHEALEVTEAIQTTFTLSDEPDPAVKLLLWVEGIKQEMGDYSISGNVLTWSGSNLIVPGTVVEVLYFLDVSSGGGSSPGGAGNMTQDVFTATAGQTEFDLSKTPLNEQAVEMFITGISQTVGIDYTVSIDKLTYIVSAEAPALEAGDTVVIKYLW